jgi:chromosome segregation ATPase
MEASEEGLIMDQTPVGQPAAPEYEARLSAMENAVSDIACDLRVLSERVDSGFREMHELRGGHNEKFAEAKEAISELRRDHEAKFAEVKEAISELRRDHEAKFADVRAAISELRRDHEAKFVEVRRRFWNRSNSSTQKSTNQMLHTRSGWT